ncbi:MAG: hypothetical protein ABWX84_01900 [Nocardioides sp.]
MNFCTNCGAERVAGRFCTNCGAPSAEAATPAGDTAERPAVGRITSPAEERPAERTTERPAVRAAGITPVEPPPAYTGQIGDGSRYPLYADEVDSAAAPPTAPSTHRDDRARSLPLWLPVLAVLVVLAMVLGVWMLTRDDSTGDPAADEPTNGASQPSGGEPSTVEDPTSPPPPDGNPTDLAAGSTATGPKPLAPGQDLGGNPVTYPPANMLDEDLATAYRIPGDASGETVVFTLPEEAEISEVGLVNGYAKKDGGGARTVDWYPLNRRILKVEWVFDDGTTVPQDLRSEPVLQTIAVDKVRTSTISLRILEVSPPGAGAMRKNVTAISDVLLRGAP